MSAVQAHATRDSDRQPNIQPRHDPHSKSTENTAKMNLLDLPAEIIRLILYTMDPDSFYNCLLTNKLFLHHARCSRALVKSHLKRIPGLDPIPNYGYDAEKSPRQGSDEPSLPPLLRRFGKAATKHLRHGASRMVDVLSWKYPGALNVDRKNSIISRKWWDDELAEYHQAPCQATQSPEASAAFIQVNKADASVFVYHMSRNPASPSCTQEPRLKYVISNGYILDQLSQQLPEGKTLPKVEVIKAVPFYDASAPVPAFLRPDQDSHGDCEGCRQGLGVMYRFKPFDEEAKEDAQLAVLIFNICPRFGAVFRKMFGPFSHGPSLQVVDMAIKYPEIAIAYEHIEGCSHKVVSLLEAPNPPEEAARDPEGNYWEFPFPRWVLPLTVRPHSGSDHHYAERRDVTLPDTVEPFRKPSIGRVIATHHHHQIKDAELNDGESTCVNTVCLAPTLCDPPF
ncbi:hypothetical protein M011DRAFT_138246 [Sporormia fimetaria CBS 119925]|uniref:F-box domain-containing protein n=1 Tax=Sporormia fimetaria CBS 119925 TaxID=1340428 RepID=A0A6A6V4L9_9PLEO|nr:hypothetical protein M011DRAFT_138246 [Sporormia fimetaria CBS 119925]